MRVHLPLLVPSGGDCGLRVAGESRRWERGKCLIFDDAFEHEAWNDTDADRVVLLFDTWHWELTDREVDSLRAMFREVEARRDARRQPGS